MVEPNNIEASFSFEELGSNKLKERTSYLTFQLSKVTQNFIGKAIKLHSETIKKFFIEFHLGTMVKFEELGILLLNLNSYHWKITN